MPRVKVGDISLYYEVHGRGDSLALIMGLGGVFRGYSDRFRHSHGDIMWLPSITGAQEAAMLRIFLIQWR